MQRTLALKKETLTELSGAELAGVVGGEIPTYATCVHECVVTAVVATVRTLLHTYVCH